MAEDSLIAFSPVSDGSVDDELLDVVEYIDIVEELPSEFY